VVVTTKPLTLSRCWSFELRVASAVALLGIAACGARTPLGDASFASSSDGANASASDGSGGASGSQSGGMSNGGSATGSRSGSSGGLDSGSGGGGPEGGPDTLGSPLGPLCPSQVTDGGYCSVDGFVCEFGVNPNPYCNDLDVCLSVGGWSNEAQPAISCGQGTYPASYTDVAQGEPCPVRNLDCAYPEGQCNCGAGLAYANRSGRPVWTCSSPPGCPEPRPRLGSSCSQGGLHCDYGACNGGVEEQCMPALGWVQVDPTCPVDGGL